MAAKHSVRSSTPGASQFFLTFVAVLLAVLTAWVVVRAAGPGPTYRQPTVVLPSMPQVPMGWTSASIAPSIPAAAATSSAPAPGSAPVVPGAPPAAGSPVPGTSAPQPSRTSPTVTPTTTPPRSTPPTTKPTTKPAPPPPPPPPPTTTAPPPEEDSLTVEVNIYSSWEQGYTTGAKLTNNSNRSVTWTVRITHSGQQNLSLVNYWNARGRQSGDTFIFTGDLAPGTSVWWGWQAGKTGHGNAHPDGCTLVGGKCTMR